MDDGMVIPYTHEGRYTKLENGEWGVYIPDPVKGYVVSGDYVKVLIERNEDGQDKAVVVRVKDVHSREIGILCTDVRHDTPDEEFNNRDRVYVRRKGV